MSSPYIAHGLSLDPYELDPRTFNDSFPLFITDCGFVSHTSTLFGQHPKWPPDWFRVKCSEITAGLFKKSMEIHFQLDGIDVEGMENTIGNFEDNTWYIS